MALKHSFEMPGPAPQKPKATAGQIDEEVRPMATVSKERQKRRAAAWLIARLPGDRQYRKADL